jgi:exodeoxyribonuclease VII large subunit
LQRDGVFDLNKQLPPPWDFNHVLVIAPEGAAGLGDFQAEASRLQAFGLCQFTYAYSRFQGEGAAAQIRLELHSALDHIRANHPWVPDALVIIRGGGAVNDLAWLNDLDLARTICELDIPVLTGIGHERDNTVLDEVAHQRFDTPSKVIAGIERVIVQRVHEAQGAFAEIQRLARHLTERSHRAVQAQFTAIESDAHSVLATARQHSTDLKTDIQLNAVYAVQHARDAVHEQMGDVRQWASKHLQHAQREVSALFGVIQTQARESLHSARSHSQADWHTVTERAGSDLLRSRDALSHAMTDVASLARQTLHEAGQTTQAWMREITGQGPTKTLQRGFALVRDAEGRAITSAHDLAETKSAADTAITIEFRDGRRSAVIKQEILP